MTQQAVLPPSGNPSERPDWAEVPTLHLSAGSSGGPQTVREEND